METTDLTPVNEETEVTLQEVYQDAETATELVANNVIQEVVNARDKIVNDILDDAVFTKSQVVTYIDQAIDQTLKTTGITDEYFDHVNS